MALPAVAEVTLTDSQEDARPADLTAQINPDTRHRGVQFKTRQPPARPQRQDFHQIQENAIRATAIPPDVCVLERMENGDFYGRLKRIEGPDVEPTMSMQAAIAAVDRKAAVEIAPIAAELCRWANNSTTPAARCSGFAIASSVIVVQASRLHVQPGRPHHKRSRTTSTVNLRSSRPAPTKSSGSRTGW